MQMEDLKTRVSKFKCELHHGVFYPTGYVVAFFANEEAVEQARADLLDAGWSDDDIIPVTGEEIVQLNDEIRAKQNILDKFMSEMLEEKEALEEQLRLARQGQYALSVYAGSEAQAGRIHDIIKPYHPTKVYGYAPLFFGVM